MNLSMGLVMPAKTPPFPFSTSREALAKKSSPIPSSSFFSASASSPRFFVTWRSTSPGERTRSGAFSDGGAEMDTGGAEGSRDGTAAGTGEPASCSLGATVAEGGAGGGVRAPPGERGSHGDPEEQNRRKD